MVSLAGSWSLTTMTSGDFFSIEITREGIFLTGKALSSVTWRDSSTTSVCGTPQQVRMKPAASSSGLRALLWCSPWTTTPSSFLHLQEPQAPSLQPYGIPMPCRMAAGRIASPELTPNERPLGCTVTWKGPAGLGALVMVWVSSALVVRTAFPILPSNQNPLGALPARFRRERVLIVGCGDVGLRVARALNGRVRLLALTSSGHRMALLRSRGITPIAGDLDSPATLARLAGLATRVVHLAPPAAEASGEWWRDLRTAALLRALRRRQPPASLVYGSTSGVYGDCAGERIDETQPLRPRTPRAQRRADAERAVRHYSRAAHVRASILRIPGIYAADREGGTPRERLLKGTPVLNAKDDVYTNHIHADDLARAVLAALWRGKPQRTYNTSDDRSSAWM